MFDMVVTRTMSHQNILLTSVQSLSHARLFVTPWTAACQASLLLSISQTLPKFMSIASVMPSNHLQFSSVTQSCLTLCDLMNHSTPGLPVHHQLLEFTQNHVHRVGNAIQPSHPLSFPFSSCPQSLPASESFPVSQFFTSGGRSIGVSASVSVFPMNIQD